MDADIAPPPKKKQNKKKQKNPHTLDRTVLFMLMTVRTLQTVYLGHIIRLGWRVEQNFVSLVIVKLLKL